MSLRTHFLCKNLYFDFFEVQPALILSHLAALTTYIKKEAITSRFLHFTREAGWKYLFNMEVEVTTTYFSYMTNRARIYEQTGCSKQTPLTLFYD